MHLFPTLSRLKDSVRIRIKQLRENLKKPFIAHKFRGTLQNLSWRSPTVIISLSAAVLLTSGLTYYLATTTSAAAVIINGQQLGLVRSVDIGQNLVHTILENYGKPFGQIAKTHDQVTFEPVRVNPTIYLESSLSEKALENKLSYYLNGYQLEANGAEIAVLPSKEAADKVLKYYEDYFVKPSAENKVTSIAFSEKVNIAATEVQADQMEPLDQALKMLMNGKLSTKDYTVQANDSWWLIARKNNMLTDEVLASNPELNIHTKLVPGQVIKLVNSSPYLTVVSQGTYSGSETIPYDIVTETDLSLKNGQTKVIRQGSNGSKLVTYYYLQKNGLDIERHVLNEKVLQNPVNQIIAKGPGDQPVNVAFAMSRGSDNSSNIVDRALSLEGTPYVFGGTTRSGFDCSGFTKYVFASSGISLPRTSYAQFASGTAVDKNNLRPGDLVFFTTYTQGASHVGIYMGGGRFVHASNPTSGIEVSSLSDSFYSSRYLGARRYN